MPRPLLPLLLLCLLGGCTSIDTQVDHTQDLAGRQRWFVIANANDSRGLDRLLANTLRARGLTAESGPRTMMPDNTQAAVTYQDSWTWDFGDRLMYLQVSVRDARTDRLVGTAQYRVKIPGRQPPSEIIFDLLDRLFADGK